MLDYIDPKIFPYLACLSNTNFINILYVYFYLNQKLTKVLDLAITDIMALIIKLLESFSAFKLDKIIFCENNLKHEFQVLNKLKTYLKI